MNTASRASHCFIGLILVLAWSFSIAVVAMRTWWTVEPGGNMWSTRLGLYKACRNEWGDGSGAVTDTDCIDIEEVCAASVSVAFCRTVASMRGFGYLIIFLLPLAVIVRRRGHDDPKQRARHSAALFWLTCLFSLILVCLGGRGRSELNHAKGDETWDGDVRPGGAFGLALTSFFFILGVSIYTQFSIRKSDESELAGAVAGDGGYGSLASGPAQPQQYVAGQGAAYVPAQQQQQYVPAQQQYVPAQQPGGYPAVPSYGGSTSTPQQYAPA